LPDRTAQTPFDAPWLDHDNEGIACESDEVRIGKESGKRARL
jgi:hypothetical protein